MGSTGFSFFLVEEKKKVWYAENMKKRKTAGWGKQNKMKKRKSPVAVFLLTFFLVLGTGFLAMLFFISLSERETMADIEKGKEKANAKEETHFFWEAIPEKTETMAETDGTRYGSLLADPQAMAEQNIYAKEAEKEDVVTLSFAGDILLDDEYAIMANLLRRGAGIENGISEPLLAKMRDADIMMLNNEFAYTNRGIPTEGKTYTFRADTAAVSYLADMGVDIVSLANNHCYDFGEAGLLDTLNTLKEAKIPYAGAGRNLEEAVKPVYYIVNDMKIAFVSATQIERLDNPDTPGATENTAGVFRCWNPEKLYEVVTEAKGNSDFVVVYIHWGTENVTEPDWAQLAQAPKLAEAGADLIIGDHPHCLQGMQYFGEVPVIYSLGNFWFNSRVTDTCLLQVDISMEGIREIRFVPAIQEDSRVDLAYDAEKERIISYMESISYGITIDKEGKVQKRE